MPRRRAIYTTDTIVPDPQHALAFPEIVPEPAPEGYHVVRGWISSAGRTRTWKLLDPSGCKVAEVMARRDAQRLADIFNRIGAELGRPEFLP